LKGGAKMAGLAIQLLGSFRVTLGGKLVTKFESDKVRALLTYLAVEADRPHRREKLAGLLWPGFPEPSARANLSRALLNLRTAVGDRAEIGDRGTGDQPAPPPLLHITRQTIQFNPEGDAWVDVTAFTRLLDATPPHSPELPVGDLEQATALYRGDFLEGFTLPGCPAFEEWALFEGEHLRRLALDALDRLAHGYEAQDDPERALAAAWRQLELDPWRESAHRQVMRLLARGGQRANALAQYETCCQRLAEELGVEPGEQTRRLYEQIRDGAEMPGPTPAPVVPHNLPAPLTPFVGRQAELAQLADRLQDPTCRLVTLVGPGGIGKTRLALEAARAQLEHFPHGVFQVRLVGLGSVEAIVPAIAQVLGFTFHRGTEPRQQLVDYLRARTVLLLLDNFEHLLEGAGLVVDILRAAPGVTAVITSRARLDLKGEQLFPVEGLPYPKSDVLEAEEAMAYDAVKLFLSGARRVCPGCQLDGHAHHVARICRTVHGMPLALLLASAWVGALSPAEIAGQVSDAAGHLALDLLETDWGDVPERHRSIRAVFHHSWSLLSEREREIFPALSVFRGGFSAEAAQAVAGASTAELRTLVNKSLVLRLSPGRYEVHELLRQYGEEALLAEPAAWQSAYDRHCAHYASALQRWDDDLKGARQQTALAEMDLDIDNARAAWDWAVEGGLVAHMEQALDGLSRHHSWRERAGELKNTWREAMHGLSVPAPDKLESSVAPLAAGAAREARLWLRIMAWRIRYARTTEQAHEWLQQGLALLDRLEGAGCDARRERAVILHQMARVLSYHDPLEARQLGEESLALHRALGDRWETAMGLLHSSFAIWASGVYGEAEEIWTGPGAWRKNAWTSSRSLVAFGALVWRSCTSASLPSVRDAARKARRCCSASGPCGGLRAIVPS
jgi:predicted ATPase/DNA-binding SARP family transcriptional activator